MGNIYPFRFRREPEPDTPRLCILDADDDAVDPAAVLATARAGNGDRLAVFGDIATIAGLADQTSDFLIDPARGNWDFFADHVSAYARASAVEAFLPDDPKICPGYTCASRYVLLRALEHAGDQPGAGLAVARDLILALPSEAVAEAAGHDPANGHALRWGMTVLAGARQATHMIADHDSRLPRVSIARWLGGPATIILFVAVPDAPTREIAAIRASLDDHAMLARLRAGHTDHDPAHRREA
ncbi:type IV secretion protein [Sphingomonas paucimobilis]|uniref:type IV secretion protein n=1 Tax=Sphingomonas paucimobilis TaxID=13689 RepID=UPI0030F9CD05